MNNYKEKLFKAVTYTAALFTIIFLFGIIASIFYEGIPIITHDLGPLPVEGSREVFQRPWQPEKGEKTTRAYCEMIIDDEPAAANDEVGAFIDGSCRGVAQVILEDGLALAILDIAANKEDEGKIIRFAIYDETFYDVFIISDVAVLELDKEIGERSYPFLCESGSPYLHPRDWKIIEYENRTQVYCQVEISGIPAEAGDEIGAFIEGECRGTGKIELHDGIAIAKLEIQGVIPEKAEFSVYDTSEHKVYGVNQKLLTNPGSTIGSEDKLLPIRATYYAGDEPQIFSRPWRSIKDTKVRLTKAYCRITINGSAAETGDEISAFVNGECRGVSRIEKDGKKSLVTLNIISREEETIQFAIWEASSNNVLGVNYNTYTNPGGQIGYSPDKFTIIQVFERLLAFITGNSWHPTATPGHFGILTLIIGSLLVTAGALIIAIPFGVGSAIYISEIASPRMREIIKPVIELLAGIPSVVYGLFGMAFLAPMLMKWFHIDVGLNILNASIILGIMVIPIISSMSEDALSMVPQILRQASYGLGANRWETIIKVVLPAAKSGVISSILLGFGRAIGETMVVIMVAGGSPQFPGSIFDPVRPMTSAIASEMGETAYGTLHFNALYGIAIVLFIITFATNLISEFTFNRQRKIK